MRRSGLALVCTVLAGPAWPAAAWAQAAAAFTPAQRQEIVSVVRDALERDPSILRDAVTALRADEERRQQASQQDAVASHRAQLLDGTGDAVAGNRVGDVTLVEFYDPRCPYCKRMVPTVDQLIAADPKLRVVFKIIPILGPQSVLESRAIVAAGRQGGYVPMQEAIMAETSPATAASLAVTARRLGLDPVRLAHDAAAPSTDAQLSENVALAKALHIDGTPALVVGNALIPGAMSLPEMQRAVADARS